MNFTASVIIDQMDLDHVDIPLSITLLLHIDDMMLVRMNEQEVASTLKTWVTHVLQRVEDKTHEFFRRSATPMRLLGD